MSALPRVADSRPMQGATKPGALSPAVVSGVPCRPASQGMAPRGIVIPRPFDPHAFRRAFPDRWSAFVRAHHRNPTDVAHFYGVTDRAARDWWEGRSAPRGSAVVEAQAAYPAGFALYLVPK